MKPKTRWNLGKRTVLAHTKSEARAAFKRMLGIPRKGRLPIDAVVFRKA